MLIEEAVKKAIQPNKNRKRVIVQYDAKSNRIHKISVIEKGAVEKRNCKVTSAMLSLK